MKKIITICIPTYKRNFLLTKLLDSIFGQDIDDGWNYVVNIVINDNNPNKDAESLVEQYKKRQAERSWILGVYYMNCIEKGLVCVRNALVEKAIELKSDYLLFIDDDEYPVPEWLREITKVVEHTSSEVVIGPVLSYSDMTICEPLKPYYRFTKPENNCKLNNLNSGNTLIDVGVFVNWGLRFDMRFNRSGSEDAYLGRQIIHNGGSIICAHSAIAMEYVPQDRISIKWVIKRIKGIKSAAVKIAYIEHNGLELFLFVLKSLFSFLIAFLTLPLLMSSGRKKYYPLYRYAIAVGLLTGLFRNSCNQY